MVFTVYHEQTEMDESVLNKNVSILITNGHTTEGKRDMFIDPFGIIADIGEDLGPQYKKEADIVLDAQNMSIAPGFVNLHTHAAMTLLRGYADDIEFAKWLNEKILPIERNITPSDVYHGTRLACLEMIRSGTTTFHDMYFFTSEAARAPRDMNMRAVVSFGFFDPGDPDFFAQVQKDAEDYVHQVRSWNDNRITPGIGPHAIYSVTEKGLLWTKEFYQEHHTPIHIHLSETRQEVETCRKMYQTTPVGLLKKTGLLHSGTITAHCCWLDAEECSSVGQAGMSVAYCPVSNMKLAVGHVMPYPHLKAAGARVGLGTDGAASNNNLNMMETMRTASNLQTCAWNDRTMLSQKEVFFMATRSGAQALSLTTGELKTGSPADLIMIRTPAVYSGRGGGSPVRMIRDGGAVVDTTICNGRILMLHGHIPGEQEIIEDAKRAADRIVRENM